jgi:type I restriction enzyme S subunit
VQNGNGLKLLRTTDISGGAVDWSQVPGCREEPENPEKYLLSPGDIVVSRAGSVGVSYLIKDCPKAIFASYLIRIKPLPPIPSEFIAYFFRSPQYWDAIAEETSGITIPNVNASKLKRLSVPLPPLAEQKRIVAKIEELLARVNATRERLTKVPAILKRFRQAILAAACSGRLAEDHREQLRANDSAENLLASISSKRRVLVQNIRSESYKEPLGPDVTLASEKPDDWVVASMDQLTCLVTSGSRGWARYYSTSGPLFVRAQDINTDKLVLEHVACVNLSSKTDGNARIYV